MGDDRDEPPKPVGYKSPPIEHRWKKSQSGNPSGKRKSAPDLEMIASEISGKQQLHPMTKLQRLLEQELRRPMRAREGDKVTIEPALNLMVRGLVARAVKGNEKAIREVSHHHDRIERGRAARRAAIRESVAKYKVDAAAQFEAARRQNVPPPDIVPHPDDIELDPDTGEVRFLGPSTRDEKLALEALVTALPQLCEELRIVSAKIATGDENPALTARRKQLAAQIDVAIAYVDRKATRERTRAALDGGSIFFKNSDGEGTGT